MGGSSRGLPVSVPSPCVSLCRINQANGLCEGCLRTLDEIAVWSRATDDEKILILRRLRQRRTGQAPRLPMEPGADRVGE